MATADRFRNSRVVDEMDAVLMLSHDLEAMVASSL